MSDKSYRSSLFKRIIDLGVVREADVDDLVRIWRVGTGDEKAITLANFVATVNADLGAGGSTLTELIEALELRVDDLELISHSPLTLGTANGLSITTGQVLSLGLASSSTTGALSGTDWNTFNGKIGGSLTSGRIPFATGANTLSDDALLFWDNTNKRIGVGTNSPNSRINALDGTVSELKFNSGASNLTPSLAVGNTDVIGKFAALVAGTTGSAFIYDSSGIFDLATDLKSNYTSNTLGGSITSRLRIFSNGNISINNTTDSGFRLDINGTARVQGNLSTNLTNGRIVFVGGSGILNDSSVFLRSSNGRIGIGVTNPDGYSFNTNTSGLLAVGDPSANGFVSIVSSATGLGYLSFADLDSGNGRFAGVVSYNHNDNTMSFWSDSSVRWRILSTGIFESLGAQTLRSSTGNLTVSTGGGNGNILIIPNGTGLTLIGPSATPTNTLDVNGTARIRTISNLGSTATRFLVASATGVISERTAAELSSDLGNQWITVGGTNIYRNSRISVNHTADPTEAIDLGLTSGWVKTAPGASNAGGILLPYTTANANSRGWTIRSDAAAFGELGFTVSNTAAGDPKLGTIKFRITPFSNIGVNGAPDSFSNYAYLSLYGLSTTEGGVFIAKTSNSSHTFQLRVDSTANHLQAINNPMIFYCGTGGAERMRITDNGNLLIGTTTDAGSRLYVAGETRFQGNIVVLDTVTSDFSFGTTTGSKIGTATSQKIGFWNATPIVQPTTGVASATLVSNAGTTLTSTDTFDGYTLQQIVRALRNTGLLA